MKGNFLCSLIFTVVLIQACSVTVSKKTETQLTGVRVSQDFPMIGHTGKVINLDTSTVEIYYYKNQILYKIGVDYFPKVYNLNDPDTAYFSDTRNLKTRYYYFIYSKGDKYGYISNEDKKFDLEKAPVDSVLRNQWFLQRKVNYTKDSVSKFIIGTIYETKNFDSGIFRKYLLFVPKEEGKTSGTDYWEFRDELKKFPYSISPELDSMYNSKLCKTISVSFPKYFKKQDFMLDTVKTFFNMEEIKNIDTGKIMNYFRLGKK